MSALAAITLDDRTVSELLQHGAAGSQLFVREAFALCTVERRIGRGLG